MIFLFKYTTFIFKLFIYKFINKYTIYFFNYFHFNLNAIFYRYIFITFKITVFNYLNIRYYFKIIRLFNVFCVLLYKITNSIQFNSFLNTFIYKIHFKILNYCGYSSYKRSILFQISICLAWYINLNMYVTTICVFRVFIKKQAIYSLICGYLFYYNSKQTFKNYLKLIELNIIVILYLNNWNNLWIKFSFRMTIYSFNIQ